MLTSRFGVFSVADIFLLPMTVLCTVGRMEPHVLLLLLCPHIFLSPDVLFHISFTFRFSSPLADRVVLVLKVFGYGSEDVWQSYLGLGVSGSFDFGLESAISKWYGHIICGVLSNEDLDSIYSEFRLSVSFG
jgi:hypothetical protein